MNRLSKSSSRWPMLRRCSSAIIRQGRSALIGIAWWYGARARSVNTCSVNSSSGDEAVLQTTRGASSANGAESQEASSSAELSRAASTSTSVMSSPTTSGNSSFARTKTSGAVQEPLACEGSPLPACSLSHINECTAAKRASSKSGPAKKTVIAQPGSGASRPGQPGSRETRSTWKSSPGGNSSCALSAGSALLTASMRKSTLGAQDKLACEPSGMKLRTSDWGQTARTRNASFSTGQTS
mmetsp:Transcript_147771/g.260530  ORF Transcript_147771/g.260530 Transcript_147771/m.260530 type:complete len:240 (+) Transcript_147771:62-781(+)